jgi:hypothetical protein
MNFLVRKPTFRSVFFGKRLENRIPQAQNAFVYMKNLPIGERQSYALSDKRRRKSADTKEGDASRHGNHLPIDVRIVRVIAEIGRQAPAGEGVAHPNV